MRSVSFPSDLYFVLLASESHGHCSFDAHISSLMHVIKATRTIACFCNTDRYKETRDRFWREANYWPTENTTDNKKKDKRDLTITYRNYCASKGIKRMSESIFNSRTRTETRYIIQSSSFHLREYNPIITTRSYEAEGKIKAGESDEEGRRVIWAQVSFLNITIGVRPLMNKVSRYFSLRSVRKCVTACLRTCVRAYVRTSVKSRRKIFRPRPPTSSHRPRATFDFITRGREWMEGVW